MKRKTENKGLFGSLSFSSTMILFGLILAVGAIAGLVVTGKGLDRERIASNSQEQQRLRAVHIKPELAEVKREQPVSQADKKVLMSPAMLRQMSLLEERLGTLEQQIRSLSKSNLDLAEKMDTSGIDMRIEALEDSLQSFTASIDKRIKANESASRHSLPALGELTEQERKLLPPPFKTDHPQDVSSTGENPAAQEEDRRARIKAEAERIAHIKAEEERAAREQAEKERREAERLAAERLAEEKRIAEEKRLAAERIAEEKRIAALKAEKERLLKEKAELERRAKEKAEQERLAREKLASEKREAERIAAEKRAREKRARAETEKARIAQLTAEREKAEAEKRAQERAKQAAKEKELMAKAEQLKKKKTTKKEEASFLDKLKQAVSPQKTAQTDGAAKNATKKKAADPQTTASVSTAQKAPEKPAAEQDAKTGWEPVVTYHNAPKPVRTASVQKKPRFTTQKSSPEITGAVNKKAAKPKPAPKKAKPKKIAVHIGSASNIYTIKDSWLTLQRDNGILRALKPYILAADAKDSTQVPFRLLAGPVKSADEALRICTRLNAKGNYCRSTVLSGHPLKF